ncbi:MAG: hypothetical protein IPK61_05850 [Saprospiraceae bacterium]|nr:hypothetical protein [Saprospiraceae bacterium]MBK9378725.1 hypothetical protein [Saprospiraceae bacterium]
MNKFYVFIVFIILMSIIFGACEKKNEIAEYNIIPITVENAKEYYIKSKPLTIRSDEQTMPTALPDVKLAWNLAYYPYPSTQAILFVPIKDTSLITNKYCDATMVFLRDSLQNISKRMLVLLMDKNYYNSINISPTLDNFTGISFQINEDFEAGVLCEYYHGEMYNYLDTCFSQLETNLNTLTTRGWPIKCPRFSNSWWESFRSGFGVYFPISSIG